MMNQLLLAVVFLVELQSGKPLGTATGFFYEHNGHVFLVTNRHVVIDETKGHKPDALLIKLHTDASNLTKTVERRIPLYEKDGKARYRVHKKFPSPPIDIAVIDLERSVLDGAVVKAIGKQNFPPDDMVLAIGQRAVVVGCPYGLHDVKHSLPIARSAMIASAYEVDFQGLPGFLVDASLHPGTSGSPVVSEPSTITVRRSGTIMSTEPSLFFLGIHSATVNLEKPGERPEPLGLATVWRANLINEIIVDGKR